MNHYDSKPTLMHPLATLGAILAFLGLFAFTYGLTESHVAFWSGVVSFLIGILLMVIFTLYWKKGGSS